MGILCLIPMRAGSERLGGKNRLMLGGKELWLHAVNVALEAMPADADIVVSAGGYSDEEREEMATLLPEEAVGRVSIVDRPAPLSTSTARMESVIAHHMRDEHELVVLLNPTSPLRTVQSVRESMAAARHIRGCAVTVAPVRASLHAGKAVADDGGLEWMPHHRGARVQSHEVAPPLAEHGAAFVCRPASIRRGMLLDGRIAAVVTDEIEAIDIDTQWDLRVARLAMGDEGGDATSKTARRKRPGGVK